VRIHTLASVRHYERHLDAIHRHLPDELRGEHRYGPEAHTRDMDVDDVVMVAGFIDIERVPRHRTIYVEHGAGQSYVDAPRRFRPYYPHSPSTHPATVIGYISPRPQVASMWGRASFAAGCPAVDEIVRTEAWPPDVAITFHWTPPGVAPEAWSAREFYEDAMGGIVSVIRDHGMNVIGHGHPRDRDVKERWEQLGVEYEPDVDKVLSRAGLLIADNTSVMYEAAVIGIPVLALNAPWYRRDVEHGLRFWRHVPGVQINHPDDLLDFDFNDYLVADPTLALREAAAVAAYGSLDRDRGRAAAEWIVDLTARRVRSTA
jgi:hypothetical protein